MGKCIEKLRKAIKREIAFGLAAVLALSVLTTSNYADAAKQPEPSLNTKKKTMYYDVFNKKTYNLRIKNIKVGSIISTEWKTSNKKVVALSKKKDKSVLLTAKKKGKATITATVKYIPKGTFKISKKRLTCKVTSKSDGVSDDFTPRLTDIVSPVPNDTVQPEPTQTTSVPTNAPSPDKTENPEQTDYGISNPRIANGVTTWDKIKFGSYYQDATIQSAEPIKWRVLSVDGDDAFLLADKILDVRPYNEEWVDATWETCTVRKWLNEEFYNVAFDDEEKKAITETPVINNDSAESGTEGGNDTKDKVYLLSNAEACNSEYGFVTELVTDSDGDSYEESKSRMAKNSDYAKLNNARSDYDLNSAGNGCWWLRSNNASYIGWDGSVLTYGFEFTPDGVRPVLHVNLSSSKVTDAGEVDSEGNVTMQDNGINNPVVKDGVTTWDCVYFGKYRQNCSFEKQDIEWRVLSIEGDDAFLLADKCLYCKKYNEQEERATWETSTLRKWLNSDFYNDAFNTNEKKSIIKTNVVNVDSNADEEEVGNDTKDNVYLLSRGEACSDKYGFRIDYRDSKTREAKKTDYAKVNNSYQSDDNIGQWWLRTSYDNNFFEAAYVSDSGYVTSRPHYNHFDIRPVIHINLSSFTWREAGQVSATQSGEEDLDEFNM